MKYVASVLINRPVSTVWQFLVDLGNLSKISPPNSPALKPRSPGPIGLGSTFSGGEGRWALVLRVTQLDPKRRFAVEFLRPRFLRGTNTEFRFESLGEGTRVTETWVTKVNGLARLFSPLLDGRTKGDVDGRLAKLKRILEEDGMGNLSAPGQNA